MCLSPSISVIIPAFNAAESLGECLNALEQQTAERAAYEVIVVDDGSSDGTSDTAATHAVRLLRQEHAGPAAARNRGAEAATGGILLFTDADCRPAADWIEHLANSFEDPEVVGAKGVYRTTQTSLVSRFVQLEYEDRYARMLGRKSIDFVDTYSAAYRRGVFARNGGFSTRYPTASVEDQELSFRLATKGYRLVFVPDAVVYHRHDESVEEYWSRKRNIGYWKALLLRQHSDRWVRDSHTPQVLKAQIALFTVAALCSVAAVLWPAAVWGAAVCLGFFYVSAIPFVARMASRDVPAAAAGVGLVLVRAIALSMGLAAGLVHFSCGPGDGEVRISGFKRAAKRVIDVVGSVCGMVIMMPFLPLVAAAIKVNSPGPVFFKQERAGERGRPFKLIKLRTMVDGAEQYTSVPREGDSPAAYTAKHPDDWRVTRVGRLLRRTSVDELPQLWNVLRGEMSLVGPRPEETRIVRLYNDWHRQRLAVKPGITGPMQVRGRGELGLDERVQLELKYIKDYSLWNDFKILMQTAAAVLTGKGAF
jgi:lipopolysaccharide/colanic/teichoic acid biosynthesis glycosyltransferase/GT2 family glycosyltransferase